MAREIKFSLVYRDMWQSSGKYVPRVDQLVEVAPAIIDMGCFDRVETNGGAFEQVNLLSAKTLTWPSAAGPPLSTRPASRRICLKEALTPSE